MLYPKYLRAAVLAAFGLTALSPLTFAQTKSSKSGMKGKSATHAKTTQTPDTDALVPFSPAGHEAIHEIQDARLAIFNGDVDIAEQLMKDAMASLETAEEEAPILLESATLSVNGKPVEEEDEADEVDIVPVDGSVTLAEDYNVTPEKKKHITKANLFLKNGKKKEALDEFKLADIGVNVSRVWMPIEFSEDRLEGAIDLMDDGLYYEASLALKAIEDSLTVDSETLVEQVPAKKAKMKK